jgi:hypothetical protein
LGIDGALQLAGAALMVYGLAAPHRPARQGAGAWTVGPIAGGANGSGLQIAGTF